MERNNTNIKTTTTTKQTTPTLDPSVSLLTDNYAKASLLSYFRFSSFPPSKYAYHTYNHAPWFFFSFKLDLRNHSISGTLFLRLQSDPLYVDCNWFQTWMIGFLWLLSYFHKQWHVNFLVNKLQTWALQGRCFTQGDHKTIPLQASIVPLSKTGQEHQFPFLVVTSNCIWIKYWDPGVYSPIQNLSIYTTRPGGYVFLRNLYSQGSKPLLNGLISLGRVRKRRILM